MSDIKQFFGGGLPVGAFIEAGPGFSHPDYIDITGGVSISRSLYPKLSALYPPSVDPDFYYTATSVSDSTSAEADTAIEILPSNRVVKVDVSGTTTGVLTARYSDDDGATWTVATTPPPPFASYGGYASGRCLAMCLIGTTIHLYMQDVYLNLGARYTTTDGITWTVADAPAALPTGMASGWYSATYNQTINKVILAQGGNYYISSAGNFAIGTFTHSLTASNNYGHRAAIVAPDGSYLVSQSGYNVHRSTDGTTWTQTLAPLTNTISNFVVAPNGVDVLLTDLYGNVYRSSDNGVTWTLVLSQVGGWSTILWVDYANGVVVRSSGDYQHYSVDDGTTWASKLKASTSLSLPTSAPSFTIKCSNTKTFADGRYACALNAFNLASTVNLGPSTPAAGYKTFVKLA